MSERITGYGVGAPNVDLAPVPIVANRAPSNVNDIGSDFTLGQLWLYKNIATANESTYIFYGGNATTPWQLLAAGAGTLDSLTDTAGTVVLPSGGNIQLKGTTNQITVTAGSNNLTWTLPSAIIAPGSLTTTTTLAATTTVTAGTGITATTGAITASSGNFVASAAASGLLLNPTVASGASGGTVAANGRVVSVTFTSPSIAGGAALGFTTSNTSITGSGTVLLVSLKGATTGAALSIQSVVNTAGQSVITVTNGTGATTQTNDLTFTYLVLN